MNFHAYIATCRVQDNRVGDFVKDARADKTLPNATTWTELESYLVAKGADHRAILAAHDCFRNFKKYNRTWR